MLLTVEAISHGWQFAAARAAATVCDEYLPSHRKSDCSLQGRLQQENDRVTGRAWPAAGAATLACRAKCSTCHCHCHVQHATAQGSNATVEAQPDCIAVLML